MLNQCFRNIELHCKLHCVNITKCRFNVEKTLQFNINSIFIINFNV